MTDTPRTRSALVDLFADNSTGNISEQDLRDFLKSVPVMTRGSGPPTADPEQVGDRYYDESTDIEYIGISTGASPTDDNWRVNSPTGMVGRCVVGHPQQTAQDYSANTKVTGWTATPEINDGPILYWNNSLSRFEFGSESVGCSVCVEVYVSIDSYTATDYFDSWIYHYDSGDAAKEYALSNYQTPEGFIRTNFTAWFHDIEDGDYIQHNLDFETDNSIQINSDYRMGITVFRGAF